MERDLAMNDSEVSPPIYSARTFGEHKKGPLIRDPIFIELPGFEPRQTDSESVVLPLHHSSVHHKFKKKRKDGKGNPLKKVL